MGLEKSGIPGERRFNTWKEIAGFFGRDERTVKRWEASRNLPVRRMPNGPRSIVYAYERDLVTWRDRGGAEEEAAPVAVPDVLFPAADIAPEATPFSWLKSAGLLAALASIACVAAAAVLLISRMIHPVNGHAAAPPGMVSAVQVPNAEAASFYRAGLYEWQTRTPSGLTHAVDDFTQAIVHDPDYALAYAGLANCYNLLREYTTMAPEDAYPRAKAAAERAIALDPSLGDAHAALAFVDFYWSRDPHSARREFERAIALVPHNAMAHHWYATFLMASGEFPQALAEIERAEALDSESTAILADKGLILLLDGRQEEATALLQRLEQTEPLFYSPHQYLAQIDLARGDNSGFLRELAAAAALRHDEASASLATAGAKGLAAAGRDGMLKSILNEQERLYAEGKESAYAIASTYASLGDASHAIAYLKLSVARHETENVSLGVDSAFARMRADSQLRGLLPQAGLPPRS